MNSSFDGPNAWTFVRSNHLEIICSYLRRFKIKIIRVWRDERFVESAWLRLGSAFTDLHLEITRLLHIRSSAHLHARHAQPSLSRLPLSSYMRNQPRIHTQVCTRWRDILYARPRLWKGLMLVVPCCEARAMQPSSRNRLYTSLVRRGLDSLVLLKATDDDIAELTRGFPLAQRYVRSLSLRCCAVTDRGLEALLDHMQVNSTV